MKGLLTSSALVLSLGLVATCAEAQDGTRPTALYPVDHHVMRSEILDEEREFRVVVPRSYGSGTAAYPVVYVLDGEANLEGVVAAADHLSGNLQMPEAIVVALHNTVREEDMTPAEVDRPLLGGRKGRAADFLTFLQEELVPYVDRAYQTSPFRILIGHSQGGLVAAYAVATKPESFTWYLGLDSPMGQPVFAPVRDALVDRFAESSEWKGRLLFAEAVFGWLEDDWARVLEVVPAGFDLSRVRVEGESHQSMVLPGVHLGLKGLFHDFPQPTAQAQTLEDIDVAFGLVADEYGHPVDPGLRHLTRAAGDLLSLRQATDALHVIERARGLYGDSPRLQVLRADAEQVLAEGEADDGLRNTMKAHLSAPRPTPEAMAPFLGEWVGSSFHEGGVPVELNVTFVATAGLVTGIRTSRIGNMGDSAELPYIQVTGEGALEYGYLNGRRPGGLIVSVLRLQTDGSLHGEQEVRGVDLERMFPGMTMPVTRETLRRPPPR